MARKATKMQAARKRIAGKAQRGVLGRADTNQSAAQIHYAEADRQAKAGNLRASNAEAARGDRLMGAKTDG